MKKGKVSKGSIILEDVSGLHARTATGKVTPEDREAALRVSSEKGQASLQPILLHRDTTEAPWRVTLDADFFFAAWRELHSLRGALHMVAQGCGVRA